MRQDLHPTLSASEAPSGGLIFARICLADWAPWLGPAWTSVCGALASGGFGWQGQSWLRLALLVLLVDGGWGTLWSALGGTDWATPIRRWHSWRAGKPAAKLPYTSPGSLGDRASRWLGQFRAWWHEVAWPACGPALSAILIALPVTLVLGVSLGPKLLLLSIGALAVMQLGLAWAGGSGALTPGWDAIVAVTLPWLAGHAAFGEPSLRSAALAAILALAWGGAQRAKSSWGSALTVGGQLLAIAFLVALHHPLAAAGSLLLLIPQCMLLPWLKRGQSSRWYVRHAHLWLMAQMLVAALAL